ncbi:LysR family transcriptional regulator [Pseudooceanicola sp.]|uniref:LysR family transcriptional regulator n=1 Tax=Pseudooceanicola sp. TaxID=1914328 RepID=UPI004058303F
MRQLFTSLPALVCFRAAAEHESFSKAAEHLNLSHGAISRAVRLVEYDLGVALFERRNRAVFLTEAGRRLAIAVSAGLDQIETAGRAIREDVGTEVITVSCEPTLMMRWLIPRMPGFDRLHPGREVRLIAGGGEVFLGRGIDLAIRRNDFSWPEGYNSRVLFEERIGPVCRTEDVHRFFDGDRVRENAPRLQSDTRPDAWKTWSEIGGEPMVDQPPHRFEHFYYSLQAAVAGLGVAIGPWHLVRDDIETGLLVAPSGFRPDGSSYVLLSRPDPVACARAFGEWVCDLSDE